MCVGVVANFPTASAIGWHESAALAAGHHSGNGARAKIASLRAVLFCILPPPNSSFDRELINLRGTLVLHDWLDPGKFAVQYPNYGIARLRVIGILRTGL